MIKLPEFAALAGAILLFLPLRLFGTWAISGLYWFALPQFQIEVYALWFFSVLYATALFAAVPLPANESSVQHARAWHTLTFHLVVCVSALATTLIAAAFPMIPRGYKLFGFAIALGTFSYSFISVLSYGLPWHRRSAYRIGLRLTVTGESAWRFACVLTVVGVIFNLFTSPASLSDWWRGCEYAFRDLTRLF